MAASEESTVNTSHFVSLEDAQVDRKALLESVETELIKARLREIQEENDKLKMYQEDVESMEDPSSSGGFSNVSLEDKIQTDNRSIYVGNVDYGVTTDELELHFNGCGAINRVTIPYNKFDGRPKGFAYVEFNDEEAAQTAMGMDESYLRGRQIKVMPKRTNLPGISSTNRRSRGRSGFRSPRGMGRGNFRGSPGSPYRSMMRGLRSPNSRGGYYAPY